MAEKKGLAKEFKEFVMRGNVVDMAVGVIIGGAFSSIVSSLVNDILMPLIGVIGGGFDFSGLAVTVGDASINYGNFIQLIINFLIVALCLFAVIKAMNALKKKEEAKPAPAPGPSPEVVLLTEIRDALKNK